MIDRLVIAKSPAASPAGSRAPSVLVRLTATTPATSTALHCQVGRFTSAKMPAAAMTTHSRRTSGRPPRTGRSSSVGAAAELRAIAAGAGRSASASTTTMARTETSRARSTRRCGVHSNTTAPPSAGSRQPFAKPSISVGSPREAPSSVAVQPRLWLWPSTSQRSPSPSGTSTVARTSLCQSTARSGSAGAVSTARSLRRTS